MKIKKVIVVAPYNTPDVEIKKRRVHTIALYCAELFRKGIVPVSALLSGLAFAEHADLPTDTKTWINFSKSYVSGCDEVHVIQLPGYLDSTGVQIEIAEAMALGIKIIYVPYELKEFNENITKLS
jgi:hypothetical protein